MALRIWLPLNGNLDNQGLSNYSFNNVNATVDTNGKIGKAYSFNGTSSRIYNNNVSIGNQWTVSIWFNPATVTSDTQYIYSFSDNGTSGSAGQQLALYTNTSGLTIHAGGAYQLKSITLATDTWYNAILTCDGVTQKLYINGFLLGSHTVGSVVGKFLTLGARSNNASGAGSGAAYFFNGKMNDFRLYDECLSDKQIKEISKGLIIHYSLRDPYVEGTINLKPIPETYSSSTVAWDTSLNGSTAYAPTSWSTGYNSGVSVPTTGYHAHWIFENGKLIMTFPNLNSIIGQKGRWLGISTSFTTSEMTAGTKYTISWWQKTDNLNLAPRGGLYYKLNASASNAFSDGCPTFAKNTKLNTWERVSYTFTVNASCDGTQTTRNLYVYGDNGTYEGTCYVKDIQVEIKDHVTPLTGGTRNFATIIHDDSGCNADGQINNQLISAKNTSRHSASVFFPSTASYIKLPSINFSGLKDSFSFSWWSYHSSMAGRMAWGFSDGNRLNLYPSTYFCWNTGDSANNPFKDSTGTKISFTPYNGAWHHYVITGNGTSNFLYIDGIKIGTSTTYKNLTGTQIYISGWSSGTDYTWTDGYISDFRIYCTELSANDILSLYKTGQIIDNQNNLLTYEFIENETQGNLLFKGNNAILDKTYKDGVTAYTQSNCQVTLTDEGFRIYRPPNLTTATDGNTMWGGLRLSIPSADISSTLIKGHTYIILYDVKGQTTNAQISIGWTNNMGWSGGGLVPTPTNVEYSQIPGNFQSSDYKTFWYKWTLSDDVYKVCTSSYSSFVEGQTYLSYNHFQVGWGYANTGALGTDLYLTNLRMYDITDASKPKFLKTGIIKTNDINEINSLVKIRKSDLIDANEFIEI